VYEIGATDGWISLPQTTKIKTYHPDPLAPTGKTTYIFGFANVTGMSAVNRATLNNAAQVSAPLLHFDEDAEYTLDLTNLGLKMRPDLVDSHTIHWHGFRNAIPMFDGEPSSSFSVPIGRTASYYYRPRDAGTYMYHCHFEDTEHVHMGMVGLLFVRPRQNAGVGPIPAGKYAYNDGFLPGTPRSTAYDREYSMFLSEIWAYQHWADAHIQLADWTDYEPDFYLLNGRAYPDTLVGNGSYSNGEQQGSPVGLTAPAGRPDLQHQPLGSIVHVNAGEKVLLRFANLGYRRQAMTLDGIRMHVVGKDATPLTKDVFDMSYWTNTLLVAPGESYDAIITAPAHSGASSYDTYALYNRNLAQLANAGGNGLGGQATEVRVYAPGTLAPQVNPHDWNG
jgi:FtsP/CotA-like multicopper oxidase with cupredoxin domain